MSNTPDTSKLTEASIDLLRKIVINSKNNGGDFGFFDELDFDTDQAAAAAKGNLADLIKKGFVQSWEGHLEPVEFHFSDWYDWAEGTEASIDLLRDVYADRKPGWVDAEKHMIAHIEFTERRLGGALARNESGHPEAADLAAARGTLADHQAGIVPPMGWSVESTETNALVVTIDGFGVYAVRTVERVDALSNRPRFSIFADVLEAVAADACEQPYPQLPTVALVAMAGDFLDGADDLERSAASKGPAGRGPAMTSTVQTIGQRIKEERLKAGLTQRALAVKVEVGVPHISKIEAGRESPSDELLERMAEAFGVDAGELMLVARRIPDAVLDKLAADPVDALEFLQESCQRPREEYGQSRRVPSGAEPAEEIPTSAAADARIELAALRQTLIHLKAQQELITEATNGALAKVETLTLLLSGPQLSLFD
jgi:transcriptional regulator with XRE-family HTH domain